MKGKPSGSSLAMACNSYDIPLVAIAYTYDRESTHFFIMTRGSGSLLPDYSSKYELKFRDKFQNTISRPMGRPQAVDRYYNHSPLIDTHNQLRQGYLRYEKRWVTQNPWYRIFTTLMGMYVVDLHLMLKHLSPHVLPLKQDSSGI